MKIASFNEQLNKFYANMVLQFSKNENRGGWHDVPPDILHEAMQNAAYDFLNHISQTPKAGEYHEYIVKLRKHAANLANWTFILQDKKCNEILNAVEVQSD